MRKMPLASHRETMKIKLNITVTIIILLASFSSIAEPENPFLDGELNLAYEGQLTAIVGEIIDIKDTKQKYPAYKVNLRIKGVNPIWTTTIVEHPKGGIKLGDMIIFKGYIGSVADLDETGELGALIGAEAILLALLVERAK